MPTMRTFRTLFLGRLALYIGVTARGYNGSNPTWLGFSYGSWWPHVRRTRPDSVPGISGYWLCFHGSIDLWPHHVAWGFR